jgi:hypothetical protein
MSDLVKCTRCRKFMIDEEYQNHLCEPIMRDCKVLKFTSYFITENSDGRTVLDITTLNGDSYVFVKVPEEKEYTKIPYEPDMRRDLTERKNDKDLTESNPETLNTSTLKYGIDT